MDGSSENATLMAHKKSLSTPSSDPLAPTTSKGCNDLNHEKENGQIHVCNDKHEEKETKVEDDDGGFSLVLVEVDRFLAEKPAAWNKLEIPECIGKFVDGVAAKMAKYESGAMKVDWGRDSGSFLGLLTRLRDLSQALSSPEASHGELAGKTSAVLQRAASFLEEELRSILEEQAKPDDGEIESAESPSTNVVNSDADERSGTKSVPVPLEPYSPETVLLLTEISKVMMGSGYETECCQVYSIARKAFLEEAISGKMGLERLGVEEVQKMRWDALEPEIVKWVQAFRRCLGVYLGGERRLCDSVFAGSPDTSRSIFANLARGVVIHLLNFAEAVAMTHRSTERLFKFLDMFEAFRDVRPLVDELFSGDPCAEIRFEIDLARNQIGEASVGIFTELETSIRGDSAKTPVPGGAVHPLTRYVMNYLKLACEYKDILEHVFDACRARRDGHGAEHNSAFSQQVLGVMDLLDINLESKSKLYKDQALTNIFLMNNGRYMVQKVKGSEIYSLLGDDWYRKRSAILRQYHKNYQRETWNKVLGCFREEGAPGSKVGIMSKVMIKERFKTFNTMFEEIHKTQSAWVVSDEQLQSELRVSISAVIIPAYRSFLARFRQHLEGGRSSDRYIKYAPEDLETLIDELFEGTPASMVKRKG